MRFSRQTRGLAARRSGPAECRGSPSVVRGRRACPRGAGARSAMFHPQTPFGASQSLPAITKRSAGQIVCLMLQACGGTEGGGACPPVPGPDAEEMREAGPGGGGEGNGSWGGGQLKNQGG